MPSDTLDASRSRAARLDAAFAHEELLGLQLAARVRVVALLVLAFSIWLENPFPNYLYFGAYLVVFGILGIAPLWLHRRGRYRRWMRYLFPALDIALLTLAIFVPNPFERDLLPTQMQLRFSNELYFFVFICVSVFSYSPAVILWTGFCVSLVWSVATLTLALLPDTLTILSTASWTAMSDEQKIRFALDPRRVNLGLLVRQIVLFLVTSLTLATFVHRVRRLVARQADAERERANLSRYFSPNLVDELASTDAPLGPVRRQDVGVLFADIVGFTGIAEALPPERVIELLRAHHARLERLVFAHGGTVDKYIGDAVMATFGTPRGSPSDASNALRCARAMLDAPAVGPGPGLPPVRIGIGLHYGPVVLGDIGGEARLEYAVIGDTVNVASRLERLTRAESVALIASDALVSAVRREAPADLAALLDGLRPGAAQPLRGRSGALGIWQR